MGLKISNGQKVGWKGKSQARSEPLQRARRSAGFLAAGGRIFRRRGAIAAARLCGNVNREVASGVICNPPEVRN